MTYETIFTADTSFNIHAERGKGGFFALYRKTSGSSFDISHSLPSYKDVIDMDVPVSVGCEYKVVCQETPSMLVITFDDGRVLDLMYVDPTPYLTAIAMEDGMSAKLSLNSCSYRIDYGEWNELPADTYTPDVKKGSKIQFKAKLTPIEESGIGTFSFTKNVSLSGSPMSLLFADEEYGDLPDWAFSRLFSYCDTVLNVSEDFLPADKMSLRCYFRLFEECSNLQNAPLLPSNDLAEGCYAMMYASCTSLHTHPDLPAEKAEDECYRLMFRDSGIVTSPAINLKYTAYACCKQMFLRCVNLKTASELNASLSTNSGYCYQAMYSGCSNLEIAPSLNSYTGINTAYQEMFQNCTKLRYIQCLYTNPISFKNWVSGVAPEGKFIKYNVASYSRGVNSVPNGWELVELDWSQKE